MGHGARGNLIGTVLMAALAACGGGGSSSNPPPPPPVPGLAVGGTAFDQAWSVAAAPDGGFAWAGFTASKGAGGFDAWVVRTDSAGHVTAERTFGGAGHDFAFGIQATPDGGFIVTGVDDAVGGTLPQVNAWLPLDLGGTLTLRKLGADLSLAWETRLNTLEFQGETYPFAMGLAVLPTADGGYAVAGATGNGGGGGQSLLVKTDASGVKQWHVFMGGELGLGVAEDTEGFVVAAGQAGLHRVTAGGLVAWNQAFVNGGSALAVVRCASGDFAVTGQSYLGAGTYLARVASQGGLVFQKTVGSANSLGLAVAEAANGDLLLAGCGSGPANHHFEAALLKVDGTGNLLWEQVYGGTGDEVARGLASFPDGYLVAGSTTSKGSGSADAYLVRTDLMGKSRW